MNKGFTLVEIMIALVIISILAAISLPNYQKYAAKAEVARVHAEMAAVKSRVEIEFLEGNAIDLHAGGYSGSSTDSIKLNPDQYIDLGLLDKNSRPRSNLVTQYRLINMEGPAILLIATVGYKSSNLVKGTHVAVARNQNGVWDCYIANPDDTVDAKILKKSIPRSCQYLDKSQYQAAIAKVTSTAKIGSQTFSEIQ